jgi:hypothetical protein
MQRIMQTTQIPKSTPSRSRRFARTVGLAAGAALVVAGAALGSMPAQAADAAMTLTIGSVDLEGPAIVPIEVTLANGSDETATDVSISFAGPINWSLYPATQAVEEDIEPGGEATVTVEILVPSRPAGTVVRQFTASATYDGGDGQGHVTTTRLELSGDIAPNLAAVYNNVGVTTVDTRAAGDYDGDGNSFSAERLAEKGLTRGARFDAAGTTFTWPDVEPGSPDNVAGGGATITFAGRGTELAFLGAGVANSATGPVTIWYADGSTARADLGFPNWGFQDPTAFGAKIAVAVNGRNTPAGFANAEYEYRVFTNTVPLDPSKDVTMVTLPANGNVHIFDLAIVDPVSMDVPVVAATKCVAGKALVTVRATNDEATPVAVVFESAYGTKEFASVEPGRNATHAFTTRAASLDAGSVVAQVTSTDGEPVTVSIESAYAAASCD